MLSQIPRVVEIVSLPAGFGLIDGGEGGLAQNVGGDILDQGIRDFVDEADILVFAGRHARNHLAPCDLGIDHGLAAAPSIVDHHEEILQSRIAFTLRKRASISENQKLVKA
jgi:hypothetical protein